MTARTARRPPASAAAEPHYHAVLLDRKRRSYRAFSHALPRSDAQAQLELWREGPYARVRGLEAAIRPCRAACAAG